MDLLNALYDTLEELGDGDARFAHGGTGLPDRLTDSQLRVLGFEVDASGRHARHRRYPSARHLCEKCKRWCKRTINGICLGCQSSWTRRTATFSFGPLGPEGGILQETLSALPSARAKWS